MASVEISCFVPDAGPVTSQEKFQNVMDGGLSRVPLREAKIAIDPEGLVITYADTTIDISREIKGKVSSSQMPVRSILVFIGQRSAVIGLGIALFVIICLAFPQHGGTLFKFPITTILGSIVCGMILSLIANAGAAIKAWKRGDMVMFGFWVADHGGLQILVRSQDALTLESALHTLGFEIRRTR